MGEVVSELDRRGSQNSRHMEKCDQNMQGAGEGSLEGKVVPGWGAP